MHSNFTPNKFSKVWGSQFILRWYGFPIHYIPISWTKRPLINDKRTRKYMYRGSQEAQKHWLQVTSTEAQVTSTKKISRTKGIKQLPDIYFASFSLVTYYFTSDHISKNNIPFPRVSERTISQVFHAFQKRSFGDKNEKESWGISWLWRTWTSFFAPIFPMSYLSLP